MQFKPEIQYYLYSRKKGFLPNKNSAMPTTMISKYLVTLIIQKNINTINKYVIKFMWIL